MPIGLAGSIHRVVVCHDAGVDRVTAHADHVGSLLRPPDLLAARDRHARGDLSPTEFKRAEDDAVRAVVALQEEAGCAVVTDGELRRESFQAELVAAVEGFQGVTLDAWLWGEWHSDELGPKALARPEMRIVAPLRQVRSLAAEELTFLRAHTDRVTKVTLPSPTLFASIWSPGGAYATLDALMDDVVGILVDEARELARLGAVYLQLDAPHYPLLIDPAWRAFYEERGWPLERWLSYGIELDNAVIDAAPGVTWGFHLCRGNQDSRWLVAGGYDDIAGPIFGGVHAHRLLLEYDDERSGSFDPLALVPDDTQVILGLVTTKGPRHESEGELEARVRDAARRIDLERLGVGTQCGFATSIVGNALTEDDERSKLATIARTASRIWG
jgi:5-methyltetrahydropteroyltriglutamate--homocysteine methyltransferase